MNNTGIFSQHNKSGWGGVGGASSFLDWFSLSRKKSYLYQKGERKEGSLLLLLMTPACGVGGEGRKTTQWTFLFGRILQ
jgi:hypothetical protein